MIGRAAVAMLVIATAATLTACASGGTEASADPARTNAVAMALSYRFEPAAVTVAAGEEVTWTNSDNFTHNVRIGDEVIGEAEPGQTVSHTFTDPGTYDYDCSLHPTDMKGTVTVE